MSVLDLVRAPELRWPLIICIVLQMSQQFSGINAVSDQHLHISSCFDFVCCVTEKNLLLTLILSVYADLTFFKFRDMQIFTLKCGPKQIFYSAVSKSILYIFFIQTDFFPKIHISWSFVQILS